MTKLPARRRAGLILGALAAVLALAALHLGGVIGRGPGPAVAPAPSPQTEPAPQQAAPAPPPETAAAPEAAAAPTIDIFRLQPDGEALIAGQGVPGQEVQILLDGAVHGLVEPGSDGRFAEFLSLPPSSAPRLLSLQMTGPGDGAPAAGPQQIVIAPIAPDAAAKAAPEASPETTNAPPMVMMADSGGARLLQSPQGAPAPQVAASIALDTISYSEVGEVQLSGRAAGEGSVRVYLDNRPVATAPIGQGGTWHTDLPKIDTGLYTLRIDEIAPGGTVTSRVETPFKREDRALLAQLQPAEDAAPAPAPEARTQDPGAARAAPPTIRVITVQPGNTLWAISRETYGEGILYVRVFEANAARIRDPDLIYPGQVFTLPD